MQKLEKQKIAMQSSEKKTTQKQLFYFEMYKSDVADFIVRRILVRFISVRLIWVLHHWEGMNIDTVLQLTSDKGSLDHRLEKQTVKKKEKAHKVSRINKI